MKVFIVYYETAAGNRYMTLLVARKVYGQPKIVIRRWQEDVGMSEIRSFSTDNYYRAIELFMATSDDDYSKLLSVGEVMMA